MVINSNSNSINTANHHSFTNGNSDNGNNRNTEHNSNNDNGSTTYSYRNTTTSSTNYTSTTAHNANSSWWEVCGILLLTRMTSHIAAEQLSTKRDVEVVSLRLDRPTCNSGIIENFR